VDPRQKPHDTARLGRARHGPGGAAPAVAAKQIGPASHRSQPAECTPADPAVRPEGPLAAAAGREADDQRAVVVVLRFLSRMEQEGGRVRRHLRSEPQRDVDGLLLEDAERPGGELLQIETLVELEALVGKRCLAHVGEHPVAHLLGPAGPADEMKRFARGSTVSIRRRPRGCSI